MAKDKQDIQKDSLFTSIAEYKDEYLKLLILAIKECLPLIECLVKKDEYFSRYFDFPTITYLDNGLPRLGKTVMMKDGPIEYKSCFSRWFQEPKINEDNITAFNEFIAFIESKPDLLKRIYPQSLMGEKFGSVIEQKIWLRHIIHEVIESYIHVYNSFIFEENNALTIATPFVNFIFENSLEIDIYIPILFLDFDIDDEISITENVSIVKLTDNFHLSRSRIKSTNSTVNDAVLDSANYALKLTSWGVKNTEWEFNFGDALYKYKSYPTELIDNFFGILRLVTSLKTGYAQILSKPINWARNVHAFLPELIGITIRAYPNYFEDYYWNIKTVPKVTKSQLTEIKKYYILLTNCTSNRITVALSRLNSSMIRDSEIDLILDATIALEALFSDDDKNEITHKLALRTSALLKLSKDFNEDSVSIFKSIKKIYIYRSSIVHGSHDLDKKRDITIDNKTVHPSNTIILYLQNAIKILLENQEYLQPTNIDKDLLLGDRNKTSPSH